MKDQDKTREQLISESAELRQRTAELEVPDEAERKRAEEAQQKSEKRLGLLIANIPDVTWTTDHKGRTVFISPNVEMVYGYTSEEIYQASSGLWLGRIHPDDVGRVKEAYELLFAKSERFDVEYRIRHKDGHWIWLHDRAVTTYEENGVMYTDGVFSDITKRKQAEEALERERDFAATILKTVDALVIVLDLQGRIVSFNRACEKCSGYAFEEVHGRPFEDFLLLPEERDPVKAVFAELKAETLSNRFENFWSTKDGRKRLIAWSNSVLQGADGSVEYVIGTGVDITERRRAEEELDEYRSRIEELVEERTVELEKEIIERERTEEALKKSEATLRSVFRAASIGIGLVNDRVFQWTNDTLHRMTGYSGDELRGKSARVLYPSDEEYERVGREKYAEIAERGTGTIETCFRRKDGQVIDVLLSSTPLDPADLSAGVTFTALDITERKRAEEEIRERVFEQEVLREAMLALTTTLDRDEVIGRILAQLQEVVPYDTASVQLLHEGHFEIAGGRGFPNLEELLGVAFDPNREDNPNREVFLTQASFIVDDAPTVYEEFLRGPHAPAGIRSWLGVPMLVGERLIGMIALDKSEPGFYTQKHAWMAEAFAAQAAIAIENAQLFEQARQEINERKQAEAALREQTHALRESEERAKQRQMYLEKVLAAAPDAIVTMDPSHRIIEWNPGAERLFGYSRQETIGREIDYLVTNLDVREEAISFTQMALSGKDVGPVEVVRHRKDGSPVNVILAGSPILVDQDLIGIVAVYTDITDRKRVEEERAQFLARIQEQARRVQQIVDTVPEGVILLDANGQVVLTNPVAEEELAVLAHAQVGDTLTHLGDRSLDKLLTSPPQGLWHDVTTDGRSFQIIARPLEIGVEVGGWVLVIRDVTRQREIEQRIQQQERLASVGQLAAGIAHDFNNIMATIVLYAQMTARMEESPAIVRERMGTIDQQAGHATKLIQQILDFSRRAVIKRRPLDLVPLLKEHVNLLRRTLPENIEIKLAYEPGEYIVHADPTRMQQMVTNLAVNARDAMPTGGTLHIRLEQMEVRPGESPLMPEMEPGEWVQLTTSDTGTGIPPDVLPHIFEPFFTTKAPLGSGLGLSQVHGIVGQHGGRIDVETQVGKGTTFTIYLPALSIPGKPSAVSLKDSSPILSGQGQTLLIVEDDAVVRKALVESLEMLNYQVLEATNGQEALAMLDRHGDEVDLLLSDVVMPAMGGVALLHALRERGSAAPVVLLTGHPLEKEMEELRAQGMADWLPKPPELEELAKVVARVLGMG